MINKEKHVIFVGMSRAGTSFMYHNLLKHPEIFLPSRKEIGYFAHHYDKGVDWYKSFYKDADSDSVTMDICGVYFTDDNALERIKNHYPEAKIILCVRDPIEWIFSFYEQYTGNFEMPSFTDFLDGCEIEREGLKVKLDFTENRISRRIDSYLNAYTGNIFVYDFYEFQKHPLEILQKIEKFVGVRSWFSELNYTNKKINASGRQRTVLFERMLQVKGFVALILALFPRTVILKVREIWELYSADSIEGVKTNYSKLDMEKANILLSNDHEYYENLFSKRGYFVG